jgi:argininosuccinate synthase
MPRASDPIVLAFSGGLDTSYCVPWLAAAYGRPVVTVHVDTGGVDAAAAADLERRALRLGAVRHVAVDARATTFERVLRFLIAGNVRRGGVYPLCVGAERLIQAQEVARVARQLGAGAVAHGSTGAGNDQVRFEVALRTLAPELEVLAPVRDAPTPRAEQAAYLAARGLPLPPGAEAAPGAAPAGAGSYSTNRGLWGVTIGGRETLDSREPLPEGAWPLSAGVLAPDAPPRPPSRHRLAFERGIPTSWDGVAMTPVELLGALERAGAAYAVGRGIHLGDTILGTKGRVAFEAPAAEIVLTAHRELEKLVLTARQQRVKDTVAATYGELVHEGQLLDPAARDVEALLVSSQARVSGEVRLLLRPGQVFVEGVVSPYSLLAATRGRYGEATGEWNGADAAGFSRIVALPGRLWTRAGERAATLGDEAENAALPLAPVDGGRGR